jgi:uncharacterized membrane protein
MPSNQTSFSHPLTLNLANHHHKQPTRHTHGTITHRILFSVVALAQIGGKSIRQSKYTKTQQHAILYSPSSFVTNVGTFVVQLLICLFVCVE